LSSRIIARARALAAVMRAGAITVPMTSGTLVMARLSSDPTAAWTNEAAAIAASDAVFDSVTFTARKLAALVVINNELLADGQGVDDVLEMAIAKALAGTLDYTALCGSGNAPEPLGLKGVEGINTVESVGTPSDYDKFLQAIYAIRADNFEPNAAVFASRTMETLSKFKSTGTGEYITPPADWAALTRYMSNQVPVNLGTGTNESLAFVGQWNQLAIGMRQNLTIEVAREGSYDVSGTHYSAFQKDQTLIRATLRADVQVLQPAAFCVMSGITESAG
jgi:HK97 family phage major capsid protein